MMWLPQQTPADWRESVEALIDVAPEHASLYLLELYPNAPLKEDMARAGWSLAPDDDAAEMYLWSLERLDAAGYRQYEISNVAPAGPRVAAQPQILAGRRVARVRLRRALDPRRRAVEECLRDRGLHPERVDGRAARSSTERRTDRPTERLEEALFTGLRLADGVDIDGVGARYGMDVWATVSGRAWRPSSRRGCSSVRAPAPAVPGRACWLPTKSWQSFV